MSTLWRKLPKLHESHACGKSFRGPRNVHVTTTVLRIGGGLIAANAAGGRAMMRTGRVIPIPARPHVHRGVAKSLHDLFFVSFAILYINKSELAR